jgi:hypothetical protein
MAPVSATNSRPTLTGGQEELNVPAQKRPSGPTTPTLTSSGATRSANDADSNADRAEEEAFGDLLDRDGAVFCDDMAAVRVVFADAGMSRRGIEVFMSTSSPTSSRQVGASACMRCVFEGHVGAYGCTGRRMRSILVAWGGYLVGARQRRCVSSL